MKRSHAGVIVLALMLALNIVFTQFMVHQFFFEHYRNTLIFAGLNILTFPVAFFIYKKEIRKGGNSHEQ
ncbi:hypothetical protein LCY76_21105 [Fictibacillus sp. KIGAM418]|uniref:Uncharacterized protein n=1 Tax=Fictibacillus marinisediminis TaxID=2878389 RepID=A0A9X1XGA4_9BACL|nr:hypothetical protein [Fictibacillus marinisediminis]MCK6259073.1 hypothetical protein [Fictibacillus marinisediminis]